MFVHGLSHKTDARNQNFCSERLVKQPVCKPNLTLPKHPVSPGQNDFGSSPKPTLCLWKFSFRSSELPSMSCPKHLHNSMLNPKLKIPGIKELDLDDKPNLTLSTRGHCESHYQQWNVRQEIPTSSIQRLQGISRQDVWYPRRYRGAAETHWGLSWVMLSFQPKSLEFSSCSRPASLPSNTQQE